MYYEVWAVRCGKTSLLIPLWSQLKKNKIKALHVLLCNTLPWRELLQAVSNIYQTAHKTEFYTVRLQVTTKLLLLLLCYYGYCFCYSNAHTRFYVAISLCHCLFRTSAHRQMSVVYPDKQYLVPSGFIPRWCVDKSIMRWQFVFVLSPGARCGGM